MAEKGEARLERLVFHTGELTGEEGLARYQALHAGGLGVRALGSYVMAEVRGWRLDRLLLFDWRLIGLIHERGRAQIQSAAFDHVSIVLLCEGKASVDIGNRRVELSTGEAIVLDSTKTMRMQVPEARLVVIDVARDRLAELVGDVGALHGRVLPGESMELLAEFLRAMLLRLDTLTLRAVRPVTVALTAMLGVALQEGGAAEQANHHRLAAERLAHIRAVSASRLGDPDFDTDDLVEISEMSRASLYRLLAPHGGVAGYLQNRRLERVRVALGSPHDRRSFAEIAEDNGFRDERQCARLFQKRFHLRPGDYRTLMAEYGALEPEQLATRAWELELR